MKVDRLFFGLLLGLGGWLSLSDSSMAQSVIVPDDTLGVERSEVLPLDVEGFPVDAISGGAQRGQNLFHSFREFNVSAMRGAYFFSDTVVQNILARVTGWAVRSSRLVKIVEKKK